MLNKKLIAVFVIALLSITSLAFAQKEEIKEYKIQKGDTLWDISKKELNDPFLWPKIWKENPDIANPDRLNPGQTIKIPLYLIEKKEEPVAAPVMEPEPVQEAVAPPAPEPMPVRIKPLIDANLYASTGYISGTVNELGRVSGAPLDKKLIGTLDMVYIKTKSPARLGDRYYVVRKGEFIKHPATKSPIGYIIDVVGIAEVKKYENGEVLAQIIRTYKDVLIGDILDTYVEMTPPVVAKPYRKPEVKGYVVAARDLRLHSGTMDIVYIDKGKKAGLEPGDLLKTVSVNKHKINTGVVQVINVMDATSVARVVDSKESILRGHLVMQAE